jgi:hypothetical protein
VSLIAVRVDQLICLFLTRCSLSAEILDKKYGINSETDVSVLDRDDFCKLVSGGLKPSPVVVECLDRGGRGGMGEGVGRLVLV